MNVDKIKKILLPLLIFSLFLGMWKSIATIVDDFPTPETVYIVAFGGIDADEEEIQGVLTKHFYLEDEEDQGIFWYIIASLQHVFGGFFLALVMGVPLGILIGMSKNIHYMFTPFIQIGKSISPLAWLPLLLFLFHDTNQTTISTIFITSIWPIMIYTTLGVKSVSKKYINLAKVLQLNTFEQILQIILPVTVPYVFTGMRLALANSWFMIVAIEIITEEKGIGLWTWNAYNNEEYPNMIIGIVLIGIVGFILDRLIVKIADFFDYTKKATYYE